MPASSGNSDLVVGRAARLPRETASDRALIAASRRVPAPIVQRNCTAMISLPILHFNDVYRVRPFKLVPSSPATIDVSQWAAMVQDVRDKWPQRPDGKREGLLLFSGDLFAPSTESSVTRGSHMVGCRWKWTSLRSNLLTSRLSGARYEHDRPGCLFDRYFLSRMYAKAAHRRVIRQS